MRHYVGTYRCPSGRVEYADRSAENDLLGRMAIAQALGKQWYDTRLHTNVVLCERCAGYEDLELREDRHYYCKHC